MMLNILMSFAQFEREMTADRIRDKIYASRKRGMWTGGPTPYGYKLVDKQLKVDPDAAEAVRMMFRRYVATGSSLQVARELNESSHKRPDSQPWHPRMVLAVLKLHGQAGGQAHGRGVRRHSRGHHRRRALPDRAEGPRGECQDGRQVEASRHACASQGNPPLRHLRRRYDARFLELLEGRRQAAVCVLQVHEGREEGVRRLPYQEHICRYGGEVPETP